MFPFKSYLTQTCMGFIKLHLKTPQQTKTRNVELTWPADLSNISAVTSLSVPGAATLCSKNLSRQPPRSDGYSFCDCTKAKIGAHAHAQQLPEDNGENFHATFFIPPQPREGHVVGLQANEPLFCQIFWANKLHS